MSFDKSVIYVFYLYIVILNLSLSLSLPLPLSFSLFLSVHPPTHPPTHPHQDKASNGVWDFKQHAFCLLFFLSRTLCTHLYRRKRARACTHTTHKHNTDTHIHTHRSQDFLSFLPHLIIFLVRSQAFFFKLLPLNVGPCKNTAQVSFSLSFFFR
jgi:hypothetical protein